jgi:hypothetical protein
MNAVATTWRYAETGLHALSTGCPAIECPGRAVMATLVIAHVETLPEAIIVGLVVDETLLMCSVDEVDWYPLFRHVLLPRFLLPRFLLFRRLLLSFNGNLLLLMLLVMYFGVDFLLVELLLMGSLLGFFLLFEISLSISNESCRLLRIWLIGYGANVLLMVSIRLGCHMTETVAVRDNRCEGTAIRQLLGWHNHYEDDTVMIIR